MSRFVTRTAYVWTACGASWFAIGIVLDSWQAIATAVGCLALAGVLLILGGGKE